MNANNGWTENAIVSNTTKEIVVEKPDLTFDALKAIWQDKVEASQLFLPSELDYILTIWIQFVRNCLQGLPNADADGFYVEAAELAAQKLKHFPDHGWKCLTMEFPFNSVQCSKDALRPKDSGNLSASSTEYINDVLRQVDFLLQLVASSNFGLKLVRTALDSSFKPTFIELKSPQAFILPNKYLELKPDEMQTDQAQKDVLNGGYDEYILPLQISNEVNDGFWTRIENKTSAE